jgi:hypothetical protein
MRRGTREVRDAVFERCGMGRVNRPVEVQALLVAAWAPSGAARAQSVAVWASGAKTCGVQRGRRDMRRGGREERHVAWDASAETCGGQRESCDMPPGTWTLNDTVWGATRERCGDVGRGCCGSPSRWRPAQGGCPDRPKTAQPPAQGRPGRSSPPARDRYDPAPQPGAPKPASGSGRSECRHAHGWSHHALA